MRPLFRAIGGAKTPEVFTTVALLIVVGTALLATDGRAVAVARRLHGGRAAVRFRIPPRAAGRHRAVRGPAAGLLLHLGRHVGGSRPGAHRAGCCWPAPPACCCWPRSSSPTRWPAWRGRTARTRCASPWRCRRPASSASCCSAPRWRPARWARPRRGWRRWSPPRRCWRRRSCSPASEALLIPRLRPAARRRRTTRSTPTAARSSSPASAAWGRSSAACCAMHGIALHRAGTRPGPGRCGAPLRQQGVFRRSDARRGAARRRRGEREAAGGGAGRHGGQCCAPSRRAKRNFPNLTILARARNRRHAHLLMDRGVDGLVRETFLSSLSLAEQALTALGIAAGRRRAGGRVVPRP